MSRALTALDRWQRRHAPAALPYAVIRKFLDDRASSHAALIAYYAFLSLFPLLLALTSILGFVLQGDPALQEEILDTALARIPVIGAQLRDDVQSLNGSGIALAVGVVGALWAGLGVTLALGRAFDEIWDVPRLEQPGALLARARGASVLLILGAALLAASVGSGLAITGEIAPRVAQILTIGAALTLNAVVFLAVFALLTAPPKHLRHLLPGVALATVGSLVLQVAGGWYVDRTVIAASDTYGTFALVIGLLSWFWLGSHLLLVTAELNVVLRRRLWPRSLSGGLEPADRAAMRQAAGAARQDPREEIAVSFEDDEPEPRR